MDSSEGLGNLIFGILVIVAIVFLLRWIGAWMLRINDVIDQLHHVNDKLNKTNERLGVIQEILISIEKKGLQ